MPRLYFVNTRNQNIGSIDYDNHNTTTEIFQIIREMIRGVSPNTRLMNVRNRGEIRNDRQPLGNLDIIHGDKIMVVNIGFGLASGFPHGEGPIGDIPILANVPPELRDVFETQRTEAVATGTYNNAVRAHIDAFRARVGPNANEDVMNREAEAAGVAAVADAERQFRDSGERDAVGRRAWVGAYNAARRQWQGRNDRGAHIAATAAGEAAARSAIAAATASFHGPHGGPYEHRRGRAARRLYWQMATPHGLPERRLDRRAAPANMDFAHAMALAERNGGPNAQLARRLQLEEEYGAGAGAAGAGAGALGFNGNAELARRLQLAEEYGDGAGAGAGAGADPFNRRRDDGRVRVQLVEAQGARMGRSAHNQDIDRLMARAAGLGDGFNMGPHAFPMARRVPPPQVPRGAPNPEIVIMERQLAELQEQRRARGARENRRSAPDTPAGRVALAGLEENIREAIPLEMIHYIDGDGFVEESLVNRIRSAAYLRGVALSNINLTDTVVRQIVKQELVRKNGRLVQAYAPTGVGDCPICLENRALFRIHKEHTVGNGVCQQCILNTFHGRIQPLVGVDGPNGVRLPQPVDGSQEIAEAGAPPALRMCGLEDDTCNRATSWYDLYKISCTTPLEADGENSCVRFKTEYGEFIAILNRKIQRQREVADETFQRRAIEDRTVNVGALDRAIEQLRQQIQQIRDRDAAAGRERLQHLIGQFAIDRAAYNRDRAAYNQQVAHKRGVERSTFKILESNALKSSNPRSICPWCLQGVHLNGGCLTVQDHRCVNPIRELERQFVKRADGVAFFCALCGRPQAGVGGHQHYTPDGTVLGPQARNIVEYYNPVGVRRLGCGGRGEYVARMIALKNVIQRHVAMRRYDVTPDIQREALLAMRDAAILYNRGENVGGIPPRNIINMLQEADRSGRYDFLLLEIPDVGPEPRVPQRPRELNQLAAAAAAAPVAGVPGAGAGVPGAGAGVPGAGVPVAGVPAAAVPGAGAAAPPAAAAAQELVLPQRPVPGLLGLGLYLGNFFIEWGGHAFDRCVPRFLRRRGGTRRHKKAVRKQSRKGRKGGKTRKN